jgi:hypothetical protein
MRLRASFVPGSCTRIGIRSWAERISLCLRAARSVLDLVTQLEQLENWDPDEIVKLRLEDV